MKTSAEKDIGRIWYWQRGDVGKRSRAKLTGIVGKTTRPDVSQQGVRFRQVAGLGGRGGRDGKVALVLKRKERGKESSTGRRVNTRHVTGHTGWWVRGKHEWRRRPWKGSLTQESGSKVVGKNQRKGTGGTLWEHRHFIRGWDKSQKRGKCL